MQTTLLWIDIAEKRNFLPAFDESRSVSYRISTKSVERLGDVWRSLLTGAIPIFRDTESVTN
jgi:hypothetical protein